MLTILSVAYPLAPVCEDAVGGAEQILAALDAAIVAAGHRSIVVAPAGSTCRGELLATRPPAGQLDAAAIHECHESCRQQIARALSREDVDLVHMHGVDFFNCMPHVPGLPVLATLHLWPTAYPPTIFTNRANNLHLQCVSHAQRRACPPGVAVSTIPNGVDVNTFVAPRERGDFALVLGRICPEKGVHLAIDATRRAGMPIVIAGSVFPYPEHERYFEREIAPRLGDDAIFVGPLDGRAKRRVLSGARCLILPSLARETSSLAAMESLASGAPVVALRSPALEELIEPGRTGWLVGRAEDLADALRRVDELAPAACRARAEAHCSAAVMTRRYLELYGHLAGTAHANDDGRPHAPALGRAITAQTLTSIGDFQRIEAPWRLLARSSPWATPFQDPEWLVPWMRHLASGCVCGLALWRRGRLLALAPLVLSPDMGRRVMRLAGTGVSDYLAPIVAPEDACALCARLARALTSSDFDCDAIDFGQLPATHPFLARLPSGVRLSAGERRAFLDISNGLADLPRRTQMKICMHRRRAESGGTVRIEHGSAATISEMTDALFALYTSRRHRRAAGRAMTDASVQRFHAEAIRRMQEGGTLQMTALRINGAVAGVTYGMQTNASAYYYAGAAAPAFHGVSPGALALAAHIEQAAESGATRLNFPSTGERRRQWWGAVAVPAVQFRLERSIPISA